MFVILESPCLLIQHLGRLGVSLYRFLLFFFSWLWTTLPHFFSGLWIPFSCFPHSCNFWLYFGQCGWYVVEILDSVIFSETVGFCSSRQLIWQDSNCIPYGGQQLKTLFSPFSLLAIFFFFFSFCQIPKSLCSSEISLGLRRIYMQILGFPLLWFTSFCDVLPHFLVFPESWTLSCSSSQFHCSFLLEF